MFWDCYENICKLYIYISIIPQLICKWHSSFSPNSASSKKSSLNSPYSTNSLSLLSPTMPSVSLSVIYFLRVASLYDFSPLPSCKLLHLYFASLLTDLSRTYDVPGTVLGAKVRKMSDTHAYPQRLVEGEKETGQKWQYRGNCYYSDMNKVVWGQKRQWTTKHWGDLEVFMENSL